MYADNTKPSNDKFCICGIYDKSTFMIFQRQKPFKIPKNKDNDHVGSSILNDYVV